MQEIITYRKPIANKNRQQWPTIHKKGTRRFFKPHLFAWDKILNKVFPTLLIYISLLVLLIVICIRTWQKYFRFARQQKEREEAAKEAEKNNKELTPSQQKRVLDSKKSLYLDTMPGPNELETVDTADVQVVERKKTLAEQLTELLEEETKQPWKTNN